MRMNVLHGDAGIDFWDARSVGHRDKACGLGGESFDTGQDVVAVFMAGGNLEASSTATTVIDPSAMVDVGGNSDI